MEETKKGGAGPSAVERETRSREYIKALLEYVKDDVRQDYLRVTGALAFAAIFVTQIRIAELQRLNRWETFVLFAGLGCLAAAAAAYFRYISETHLARRPLAERLLDLNEEGAKEAVNELFKKREGRFRAGTVLFVVGVGLLAVVLWVLVTGSPNAVG